MPGRDYPVAEDSPYTSKFPCRNSDHQLSLQNISPKGTKDEQQRLKPSNSTIRRSTALTINDSGKFPTQQQGLRTRKREQLSMMSKMQYGAFGISRWRFPLCLDIISRWLPSYMSVLILCAWECINTACTADDSILENSFSTGISYAGSTPTRPQGMCVCTRFCRRRQIETIFRAQSMTLWYTFHIQDSDTIIRHILGKASNINRKCYGQNSSEVCRVAELKTWNY